MDSKLSLLGNKLCSTIVRNGLCNCGEECHHDCGLEDFVETVEAHYAGWQPPQQPDKDLERKMRELLSQSLVYVGCMQDRGRVYLAEPQIIALTKSILALLPSQQPADVLKADKEFIDEVKRGVADCKAGRMRPWDKVQRELGM